MATSLPDDVKALLDGPNFAHLATLRKDGSPQVDPVWVSREGNRILVGTGEGTVKAKNSRRDPRVGLSIVGFRNPYAEAMIRCRCVEKWADSVYRLRDERALKYSGKGFSWRGKEGRMGRVRGRGDAA